MADHELIEFVQQTTGECHFRVEQDYGNGFVRLESSEAERRQAKQDIRCVEDAVIEMLRNSRDAGAHLIFLATSKAGNLRTLTMIDDGSGIPADLHKLVFEPRVTSKLDTFHEDKWGVHGRGMALFSIKENAKDARVVASAPGMGSSLQVVFDTDRLTEKTDQSSMPVFVQEEGRTLFRGPKNINRTVGEFSLDERGKSLVFLGSGIEIAAALYDLGCKALSDKERIFHKGLEAYPLYLRPSLASGPDELTEICQSLGLELSTRSARRIIDGQIKRPPSFLELLTAAQPKSASEASAASRPKQRKKAVNLSEDDLQGFGTDVMGAYKNLAAAYYLNADVQPKVYVRDGELVVKVPLLPDDLQ